MAFESTKPTKRKLLDDSDSDSDDGGAAVEGSGFAVNQEYARRFEHNKKREERQRCRLPPGHIGFKRSC
jgi:protein KRI1